MTLTSLILVAKTNLSGSMSSIIMLVAFAAGGFVGWKVYSKFEKPGLSPLETDFKAFALAAVAFFAVVLGIGYCWSPCSAEAKLPDAIASVVSHD